MLFNLGYFFQLASHSFPTRRSSDLDRAGELSEALLQEYGNRADALYRVAETSRILDVSDRKSTRMNSSHQIISYAVFCLKKKTYKKFRVGIKINISTNRNNLISGVD